MRSLLNLLHVETFDEVAAEANDLYVLKTLNNDLFGYAYYKDNYRLTEDRVESVVLRRLGFEAGVCGSHPFDPAKMKRLRDDPRTHASVRDEVLQQLQVMDELLGIRQFAETAQRDALRESMLNTRKKRIETEIRETRQMWSLNTDDVGARVDAFLKCSLKHAFEAQSKDMRHAA